ncbi:MAG TPA: lysophospholipid acyltransferase family protein [Polyangiaceae bacterium]|nr:lysophospholipid acyltransferase family protein [Polyangiaceae bacterium]
MIPARKSRLFTRWFSGDAERRMRGAFGSLRVRGLEPVRVLMRDGPVLIVSNHTAWWDPLVVLVLTTRVLGADAFAMMDAKNLRRLPFFGLVGAFGVDLDVPADGARAIRYAAKLLDRPGRVVWIFAQGRERPVTTRPLGFRGGTAEIARVARRAAVLPVALRYEHGARPEPDVYVSFGAPLERATSRDADAARLAQEAAVTAELDALDAALDVGDVAAWAPVFEARPSRLMGLLQAALAWLTRPRVR